ncbi:hypothetical protein HOH87_02645 [bacterium]|jgi:hypothetical protein|nr:hypothetical protein [bacterium]
MNSESRTSTWIALFFLIVGAFSIVVNYGLVVINLDFLKYWPCILIYMGVENVLFSLVPDKPSGSAE